MEGGGGQEWEVGYRTYKVGACATMGSVIHYQVKGVPSVLLPGGVYRFRIRVWTLIRWNVTFPLNVHTNSVPRTLSSNRVY